MLLGAGDGAITVGWTRCFSFNAWPTVTCIREIPSKLPRDLKRLGGIKSFGRERSILKHFGLLPSLTVVHKHLQNGYIGGSASKRTGAHK